MEYPEQIKEATIHHFESIYNQNNGDDDDFTTQEMLEHIPQCITTQDNYSLTKEIEEVEIV